MVVIALDRRGEHKDNLHRGRNTSAGQFTFYSDGTSQGAGRIGIVLACGSEWRDSDRDCKGGRHRAAYCVTRH